MSYPIPRRASAYTVGSDTSDRSTEELVYYQPRRRTPFRFLFILGMVIVLVALIIWNLFILPWWSGVNDQWHYGEARVTRLDADVGHGGISTFIAFDLNGQVTVIEMPGGNSDHAKLYRLGKLVGEGKNYKIITLRLIDANNDGKIDLVIHVEGIESDIVLYNTGSAFQWIPPQS